MTFSQATEYLRERDGKKAEEERLEKAANERLAQEEKAKAAAEAE